MLTHAKLAFLLPTHNNQTIVLKLKRPISTFPSASNSVVLSLAAYLLWTFPDLPHPEHKNVYKNLDETYPSSYLSLHPLFELWTITFCETILAKNAIREGDTLFFLVEIGAEYETLL